jgi:alpha-glucosidase
MDIRTLLYALRSLGPLTLARTARYSQYRDRLDRPLMSQPRNLATTPGLVLETILLPSGASCKFEHAEMEMLFLAPDLVRITWHSNEQNAHPPQPYALACQEWPPVTDKWEANLEEMNFSTRSMSVTVQGDGGLLFRDQEGNTLRQELPPEFYGAACVHQALLQPDERIYGLGERSTTLNRRGGSYRMWNTDPGGAYGPQKDPLYLCIPLYIALGPHGSYLAFYENSYPATFTFENTASARFEGGQLRYYIIPGPLPRVLERYTELTGRAALPPRWVLGYHQSRWGYRSEADIRRVIAGFKERDLPISAIHLDIDYMDDYRVFTVHPKRFPNLKKLVDDLEAEGVKTVAILDPGIKKDSRYFAYRDGLKGGHFVKQPNGKPLHGLVWPGWSAFPDFTNPKARQWWGDYYLRLLEQGIAGFWHDMNEPTSFASWGDPSLPLAAVHDFDGHKGTHAEAHNLYGLLMARSGYEALRKYRPNDRPWVFTRSGWAGVQGYAWSWTADVETSWAALRMTIPTILGLSLSGLPFSGPDIGGFSGIPTPELYMRWFQLAAFLPFFRTHSAIGTPPREPWVFGEAVERIVRETLRLRYRLLPYLYTLVWETSRTGHPPVRPLFWPEADESQLQEVDDAFLLGDALLVAPILEEGALSRKILLPKGEWYDWWGKDKPANLPYPGTGEIEIAATLEHIPLLVRAGSILPMEENDQLVLHVFPPTPGKSVSSSCPLNQMYSDAGDGYGPYRLDHYKMTVSPNRQGTITWLSQGDYPFPYARVTVHFHGPQVQRIVVDGKELPSQDNIYKTGVFQEIQGNILNGG